MENEDSVEREIPLQAADEMARAFSGVEDEASRRKAILQWLLCAAQCAVLVPIICYLQNRFWLHRFEVGEVGWGLTVFFVVYCLLWALGLYFRPRQEYHTTVRLRGDWLDRIAAFWLVGCAFGPFLGWIATTGAIPITLGSWRWLYGTRAVLAAVIPLLLALPMLRYVRGKAALVQVPLLLVITFLPVATALRVSADLRAGPVPVQDPITGKAAWSLAHTGVVLDR